MKLIYSEQSIELDRPSIFLAGPTPRHISVSSWRPEALQILKKLNFDGTIFVPEYHNPFVQVNFIDQVEWEYTALESCNFIVFWVPRCLKTMPAFTTNVEFGSYIRSSRAYYGRPDGSEKNDYLDWLYKKTTGRDHFNNLDELLTCVVFLLKR